MVLALMNNITIYKYIYYREVKKAGAKSVTILHNLICRIWEKMLQFRKFAPHSLHLSGAVRFNKD